MTMAINNEPEMPQLFHLCHKLKIFQQTDMGKSLNVPQGDKILYINKNEYLYIQIVLKNMTMNILIPKSKFEILVI